jgi:hypothetical protein
VVTVFFGALRKCLFFQQLKEDARDWALGRTLKVTWSPNNSRFSRKIESASRNEDLRNI